MTMLYKDLREGTDLLLDPSANVDTVSISSISSETVSSSNKESSTSFYETFKVHYVFSNKLWTKNDA